MIYTSYFANLKNLPSIFVPISICGKAPDWYHGLQYKKLAPKYDFFMKWKENHDNDYYIGQYKTRVLGGLNFWEVYDELYELAESCSNSHPYYEICLICYESPQAFCHRHLVSDWFNQNGILCEEFNGRN